MRRWPWKKHERWAGKGPAEGLEWSERVGWGAGEDLGRTTRTQGHQSTPGRDSTHGGGDPLPWWEPIFSLWDPSTTPFFSCHRPLGHGGDTFPCPTCQHPRSPREGPHGTLVPGVTQHVGPPPLSHARPRGLGWRGVAAPVMLWGKKRGEFGKGGTEPGGGAGCGGTERAGDIGGLVGGR